ncbi:MULTISPECIES: cupin domain-containing protein [Sphingomonas]|jgi:mannose-6-phosphate isomerase-like protein (cupin superfamily)|uniref:cupin domain-containing protein n=1 Tax=Sphingomonas TaxID=13687 RepID=UPI0006F95E86|nr:MULTISPECIES: cupin domain-containing protein [Sphingomonas]KQM91783.1 cupin [Sphingomonas sp. Leaf226]MDY0967061.1 cupin domain-containing protein [Sphingomonas sp. CFBP9021]USQ99011.1 cupin domain-containing protein [Sphingomonas aerolata]
MRVLLALATVAVATVAPAQEAARDFAAATDIPRAVAALEATMKPGQGFAMQTLVSGGGSVVALEYWKAEGRPAVHPDENEYATVVAGSGTLLSGGRLVDPHVVNPGLTDGARIEGGTTRALRPGDVLLIPAGVPHGFGVGANGLVLLGTKITPRRPAAPAR